MECRAYLDIETTGLSPERSYLTVIGIYREDNGDSGIIQLVGDGITRGGLVEAVSGVTILHTYNGKRFDLPFINAKLGINLSDNCIHEDLMYACWKKKLKGGLKSVERQLGIERELPDVDGFEAVKLWHRYEQYGDRDSLNKLLKYNEEDVMNLIVLREMLLA